MTSLRDTSGDALAAAIDELDRTALPNPVTLSGLQVQALKTAIINALMVMGRLGATKDFRLASDIRAAGNELMRTGSWLEPRPAEHQFSGGD